MGRKILISALTIISILTIFLAGGSKGEIYAQDEVNLYIFYSQSCPHCAEEIEFLKKIAPDYPNLDLIGYEVSTNNNNALLFQRVGKDLGLDIGGVPMTFIGNDHLVGFRDDETTGKQIVSYVEKYTKEGDPDIVGKIIEEASGRNEDSKQETTEEDEPTGNDEGGFQNNNQPEGETVATGDFELPEKIDIPLLGEIKLRQLSLPALTFVIALVDGFNPCAMWVLLFLISMLLGMKDRKRMWLLGSTFIFASGFVYFLFLSAWLNLFLFLGFIFWVRVLVGLIALGMGVYQLRDFWVNRSGGCKVAGDEKRRRIFDRIRNITHKRSLLVALMGIVFLAFAVNLVELVCSAGLPAVYTQVLALNKLNSLQYYAYLLFYIFIFMIDDLTVFIIAMITLHAVGVESKYARYSRLIGGVAIFIIGILMLFRPGLLMFG
jgi:glutaredoxin